MNWVVLDDNSEKVVNETVCIYWVDSTVINAAESRVSNVICSVYVRSRSLT